MVKELNSLPWPIAYNMDALKGKLEIILEQIRSLDRPVPPKAIYMTEQIMDICRHIIERGDNDH